MKWIVALAALLTAAPSVPQEVATGPNTPYFTGLPPAEFQSDNAQVVVFTSTVTRFCGEAPEGIRIIACSRTVNKTPVLFLPNPCLAGQTEYYARIACHELGHRNGWSGNHPMPELP